MAVGKTLLRIRRRADDDIEIIVWNNNTITIEGAYGEGWGPKTSRRVAEAILQYLNDPEKQKRILRALRKKQRQYDREDEARRWKAYEERKERGED